MYESPSEWTDAVSQLLDHKASLNESDPTYNTYSTVLNGR